MGFTEQTRSSLVRIRETFGEPGSVIYTAAGESPVTLTAYFRAQSLEVDLELAVTVNTLDPTIGVFGEDLPADPGPDDFVEVGLPHYTPARRYRVKRADPDGHGWWEIFLVKAKTV